MRRSVVYFSALALAWAAALGSWFLGPGLVGRWQAAGEPLSGPRQLVAGAVSFVREWPLSIGAALIVITAISLVLREPARKTDRP